MHTPSSRLVPMLAYRIPLFSSKKFLLTSLIACTTESLTSFFEPSIEEKMACSRVRRINQRAKEKKKGGDSTDNQYAYLERC
jgi:hypothetical protein